MALSFTERIVIAPDILVRMVGDESVLLNLNTEMYLGLDAVGTRMWTVLQDSGSLQEACARLLEEFDVDADRLRADLDEFVATLRAQGLIQPAAEDAP